MAHFASRSHGHEWFTRNFLATGEQEAESKKVCEAFLTPKPLSTRLGTFKENMKILCYHPNMVSCQFGVSQAMPNSLFNRKSELWVCIFDYSGDEYLWRLFRNATDRVVLTPFSFQQAFYSIREFDTWWRAYHEKKFLRLQNCLNI